MITFEKLTQEEKYTRALAEIYSLLLKLAEEKQSQRGASVDSNTINSTLTTEYPPQV
jgi:hypothetical protein